jgi:hypothetical protein
MKLGVTTAPPAVWEILRQPPGTTRTPASRPDVRLMT